MSKTEPVLAC